MTLKNRQTSKSYLYFMGLTVLTFAVYWPILNNLLLDYWDDQWVVMNNYTRGGLSTENIWAIMTDFYHGQYAPFNEFLYLVLYSFDDYNPFVFHLASLLIHLINSWLVFITLKKLLILSGKVDINVIPIIAFLSSAIFCIHPLNVESVAWMSASKVLVYAFFYLLATYTFLLFLESTQLKYYLYTVILYIFSFLGKEQAVVFPIWMSLLYYILNYNLLERKVWTKILPFFILSLCFGIITILSQYPNGTGFLNAESNYPFWQRIIFGCYSYLEYIFKIVFPVKLSYLYAFPSAIGDPLPAWFMVYPIIILIILVSLWQQLFIKPAIAWGMLFFTIHIAVALHVIPLSRFVIIADRYAYLAVIGIGSIIAYYTVVLYNRLKRKNSRYIMVTLFCGYLLYCGIYAHQRTFTWYNVDTLKRELRELLKQRNDYQQIGIKSYTEYIVPV